MYFLNGYLFVNIKYERNPEMCFIPYIRIILYSFIIKVKNNTEIFICKEYLKTLSYTGISKNSLIPNIPPILV